MDDHDLIAPITGKWIKSDGTVVDAAEMIEALYKALVVNKNAGVEVDGMGHVDTVAVTDPDAETANQLSLLRGLLKQLQTKVVTELSGSIPGGINKIGNVGLSDLAILAQQTISAPSTGTKTVTSVAAEAFAGASARTNRKKIIIKNEDAVLRFRVGAVDITQDKGFTVEPKAFVEFAFDPGTYVPIYIIAETADLEVEVYEE